MKFKGHYETESCDDCGREIATAHDFGFEDVHLCSGCSARRHQDFVKTPCKLCNKLMGDVYPYWNPDGDFAHEQCINKLTEEEIEDGEWTNEI